MLSAKRVVWQRFARTKWAGLSLLLGFGGAWIIGACIGEIGPAGSSDSACPAETVEPPVEQPTECASPATGCKRFYLPLLGNPSMNPELAAKYRAAFGLAACYVPADPNAPFNCWYKKEQMGPGLKGCTDAQKIAEVYGAAKYEDHPNTCKQVPGTEDFSLQVGPDVANKIFIRLGDAPLESSLIEVDGGAPLEVNGPYRNLPTPSEVAPGNTFHCAKINGVEQWEVILQANRDAHKNDAGVGEIHSDLAGFMYPCKECGKLTTCTEPLILKDPETTSNQYDRNRAEVHHEVRAKDLRDCKWGTNANSNAVVISLRLNRHLSNRYPSATEVNMVNKVPPYTYSP